jgi:SH3 domain protein
MRNGLLRTIFLLLLCQGANAVETVYVHDELRLGVRAAPEPAGSSIAVVITGDALTVLGEQDSFTHIRTEKGLEGWVSTAYVSAEPPARNQLKSLQEEHGVLQQERSALQQQRSALQQQLDELHQQTEHKTSLLEQLAQDNVVLQQQLASQINKPSGTIEQYRWLFLLALLSVCFITGAIAGVRWKSRRVAERLGGLEL